MARKVANVDIITDSFEIWLLETNELLNALSTEIMTANATYANTGNSTFDRTAQLYGMFGSNNLVVSNWLRGGNVNGQFANLFISTNTNLSNTNAANINLMVANGSTFSYVNPYGGYFGNTSANSFINSIAIITQSSAIVNTNISPTLIQIANSQSTANITPSSFKTGIFQANTIEVQVGANVVANATSLYLGNASINSVHTQAQSTLANSIHSTLITQEKILVGNSSINALANSTLITIANSTSSANVDPISFKTGIFTGNTIAMSIGANVIANATSLYLGNASINSVHTQAQSTLANSIHSTLITQEKILVGNSSINALANSTLITIANSTSSANVDPTSFKTGIFTGNTLAVSVGANVIANSTALYIGNASINTITSQTTTTIANSTHSTVLGISTGNFGNSIANTSVSQVLIQAANASVTSNVSVAGFVTGIFAANQTTMSVGANVIANATTLFVGNASINTITTQTTTTIANSSQSLVLTNISAKIGNNSVFGLANNILLQVLDATSSANIDSTSFKTGIFTGNTTAVSVGANVVANATTIFVGNASINTITTQTTTTIANATHNTTLGVSVASFGNATANTTTSQTRFQAANLSVTANVSVAGFVTGIFTANQTVMSVGANVYANATTIFVGNASASIAHGNNTITGSANIGILPTSYLNITGAFTASSNVALSNTLIVTGAATLSNTLLVTGLANAAGNLNTPTANASAAINVGANVNLTLDRINVGNATVNTFITSTAIETDGTLTVLGATSLANTLTVTGNTTLNGITTIQSDYVVEVTSNTNLGLTTGAPILAYRFVKATFSSAKITAQVKNTGNTQISEMVIAHDGTTAFVTVFGTVASPGFANNNVNPLATFTANVNGANVDLLINQSAASSAAKFIAHLIK